MSSDADDPVPVGPGGLCRLLGIRYPIIQDGMGPYGTAGLAAAVSSAGGLGTVSIPGLAIDPAEARTRLRAELDAAAERTERPFAVNIPVGVGSTGAVLPITDAYVAASLDARKADPAMAERLVACITSAGFSEVHGRLLQEAGMVHVHKVGAVRHARKAAAAGVDVLIASGSEMGGHTHEHPVHTMVLAPQVIEAVDVPVVVSGGIHSGRGLAAALAMGAAGVAMGTRFVATVENEWHPAYKRAIVEAAEWSDRLMPGVYGPIRVLAGPGADDLLARARSWAGSDQELSVWKEQRIVSAMRDGDVEDGVVLAGQCAAAIDDVVSVFELLPRMMREAASLLLRASRTVAVEAQDDAGP
jgi:NAD(P)H-dependent flavin oxidoreductase YrpB (nitropropane dioxygenase family)